MCTTWNLIGMTHTNLFTQLCRLMYVCFFDCVLLTNRRIDHQQMRAALRAIFRRVSQVPTPPYNKAKYVHRDNACEFSLA